MTLTAVALFYDSIGAICKIYSLGGRVMARSAALTKARRRRAGQRVVHILRYAYAHTCICVVDILLINYDSVRKLRYACRRVDGDDDDDDDSQSSSAVAVTIAIAIAISIVTLSLPPAPVCNRFLLSVAISGPSAADLDSRGASRDK